jgi:hypothetical protein
LRDLHVDRHRLSPPLPPQQHYATVPHAHADMDSSFHDRIQSSEAPYARLLPHLPAITLPPDPLLECQRERERAQRTAARAEGVEASIRFPCSSIAAAAVVVLR